MGGNVKLDQWDATGTGNLRLLPDESGAWSAPRQGSWLAELLCIAPLIGTGGNLTVDPMTLQASNAKYTLRNIATGTEVLQEPRTSDTLSEIRAVFGTSISQTAQVLGVKRQTVYAWLENKSAPQPGNRVRLEQLTLLARAWRELSSKPLGSALHSRSNFEHSLFQLLTEESLRLDEIKRRFRTLQRASAARQSPRDWARAKGLKPLTLEDQQRIVDRETGKRLSED
jgi:DNA-binding transcriptional regulator YiaG